jgi:putative transposase
MILTYKYRLKQRSYGCRLRRHATSLNQVWNYDVALQRKHYTDWKTSAPTKQWLTEYDLNSVTSGTSKELQTHAGSIYEINRYFVQSRDKNKCAPKFRKSFGAKRSLGWVPFRASDRKISGNAIHFVGKTYKWFNDRPLPLIVKGGAFVEDSRGNWYVCFNVDVDHDEQHGENQVGIDLGLKTLATLSDGTKVENPKTLYKWANKLAVAQRANKKDRVKAIHEKIKNIRNDYQHKETTKLINQCKTIIVGNVSSTKLVKTKMAKAIYDASWGGFKNMLRYKASRHGVYFVEVNEKYSTQMCSSCGVIPDSSPKGMNALGIREWVCSNCWSHHDRDVNAAKNILILGLSTQPLAEGIGEVYRN